MKNGFVYILALLFAVAFSSFIAYDSEKARSSRAALGVIFLAALTAFLLNSVEALKGISYTDSPEYDFSDDESFVKESAADAFAEGVESWLIQKFFFYDNEINVTCEKFDPETVSAEKIKIYLSGKAAFADIRAVREHVEKSGLGECEVIVLFE